jgi:hypothetical protein
MDIESSSKDIVSFMDTPEESLGWPCDNITDLPAIGKPPTYKGVSSQSVAVLRKNGYNLPEYLSDETQIRLKTNLDATGKLTIEAVIPSHTINLIEFQVFEQ